MRIGLTGGIGSGKSTVATLLVARGATLIDADAISRGLTAPGGAAIGAIATAFGADFITADGAMDRPRMREHVFADTQLRQRLEAILHPLITAEIARRSNVEGVRVFDVPLLVESGRWRDKVDRVLVVDCAVQTQVERVHARSGWPRELVLQTIAQQASREQRLAAADGVLYNEGIGLEALAQQVDTVWRRWNA